MKEFERIIRDNTLKLEGKIDGYAPVQGCGTINGFPFYFRARHEYWSFAISEDSEVDPVDIGLFENGEQYGFFKEEYFGNDASWMRLEIAEQIIITCCKEYYLQKYN